MTDLISKKNITEDDIECEEFYNICQAYRHAKDNGDAGNAYSTLKQYIAQLLINSAPVVNGEAVNISVSDAPKKIYLCIGDTDFEEVKREGWSWNQLEGVTWCTDRIDQCDIPYVRADLPQPQSARDALENAAKICDGLAQQDYCVDVRQAATAIRALIEHDAPSEPIEGKQNEVTK